MKANWKQNKYFLSGLTAFLVVAASIVFYHFAAEIPGISVIFSKIMGVLMPFTVGLTLAYLLLPVYNVVQRPLYKLLGGKKEKPRRFAKALSKIAASVVAMIVLLAVVVGLLSMVIPQAYQSVANLINNMPAKTETALTWLNNVFAKFGSDDMATQWISQGISKATEGIVSWAQKDVLPNLGNIAKKVSTGVVGVFGTVTDVIVGVIICFYTLNSKEIFVAQAKKATYSLFKPATANYVVNITRYVHATFGQFINGIILDAFMVGTLCFIGMSLFRMPYALLISAIVGLFNIVPIFGPIVAGVIGTFFLLLEDPIKAVIFFVFVLVLQQIDGNIVAPKILGDKTGLPSFWVIFAIVVGGGLFGLPGMVLGVPAFAVLYALIDQYLENRLRKKGLSDQTEAFDDLREIDEVSGEPKYGVSIRDVELPEIPPRS